MHAVHSLAVSIGGLVARASWLGPEVGGHLALFCIHHVNRVNSGSITDC